MNISSCTKSGHQNAEFCSPEEILQEPGVIVCDDQFDVLV